ncbi:hypothetical protein CNBA1500 [Cryptococcus deneoformans B-3501A]|uniref:hypothetical protein n=1 Tax=Cryptococcus deneoformans (strain B-3501A) TaxID=283643 RepID=UPI000042CB02|nr:hypothetical protein CNBA1500 [Cryptococcus neoformans var. neoformans B-3501A]EAL23503.1 hypothetical protein CNBA1500 [Cryptococcus neoformans var. neoformans B-3501A]
MSPQQPANPSAASHNAQLLQSHDLVASLPTPYLRLLVLFARPIALFKHVLQVFLWSPGRRVESWMVVGAWWALCLGSQPAFRFLLPPLVFLPLLPLATLRLKNTQKTPTENSPSSPATHDTLLLTLSDLNEIYALLPISPLPAMSDVYARFRQLGPVRLIRGLAVLWGTWLVLGQLVVGYKTLLALIGTVILLLPSPPLAHFINLLSGSLFFRQAVALAFLFTFGSPPETSYRFKLNFSLWGWFKSKWTASRRPSLAFAFRPKMSGKVPSGSALEVEREKSEGKEESHIKVESPIYFRFEIHENQRWWMGLDWTSALLPQERPSWCDSHLLPVSPPQAFTLPAPVSVVINTATMKDRYARVMRSAEWKWLDDDWSIVRSGPGASAAPGTQTNPVLPPENDPDSGHSLHQGQHHNQPQSPQARTASRPSSFISAFGSPTAYSPSSTEDSTSSAGSRAQSIAEQAFTKGLERLKARAVSGTAPSATASSPRRSGESVRGRTGSYDATDEEGSEGTPSTQIGQQPGSAPLPSETIPERDAATDADGWVYGDNKWENVGSKGGLGKFTRRRRWRRRAICIETVRKLSPSDDPAITISPSATESGANTPTPATFAAAPSSPLKSKPAIGLSEAQTKGTTASEEVLESVKESTIPEHKIGPYGASSSGSAPVSRDEMLRMRLKKAMGSVGA